MSTLPFPLQPTEIEPADHDATRNLSAILADALHIFPPLYWNSIFGMPTSWVPPFPRFSEYQIINLWRPLRMMRTLVNWTVPSIPAAPPPFGPPLLNDVFFGPTEILHRPDHHGSYNSFPDERWIFVNGIMTNDAVAQLNSAFISRLFHRPVTMVQNSTDSLPIDLLECAVGKQWQVMTTPAIAAFPVIYDALIARDVKRVVVLAHSQGTIIMSNVLRWLYQRTGQGPSGVRADTGAGSKTETKLEGVRTKAFREGPEVIYTDTSRLDLSDFDPLSEEQLNKLEVYCFATCANELTHFAADSGFGQPLPRIEHFGNEFDIVARLGMQAPQPEERGIVIEGDRYMCPGAWGHLLNEHYLFGIDKHQRVGRRKRPAGGPGPYVPMDDGDTTRTPRLFHYINGGTP